LTPEYSKEITGETAMDTYLGREIGIYRLVERIGEGGMGAVYRAVENRPPGHSVAIKLIKRGMDTEHVLRRFYKERQILAALDHPHIARLLDAGATPEGDPYVVMEYIPGKRLLTYCDEHRLSVAERLRLFRKVCSAVEYAHQKHVVHRDIKPSNILVPPDGEPKLLDFGIAKVLDHEAIALSGETQVTMLPVMTPQYASPEQARGEPVTPASDIYSLGVVLYELLTGRRPYKVNTQSAHEIVRAICEQYPERPSSAAVRSPGLDGITPQEASATREGDPVTLRRRLAGDLDAILLKALMKEPARRYSAAAELSEDLRRHLEGEPVAAPRPGPLYPGPSALLRRQFALITVVLVIAAAFAAWAWWRAASGSGIRMRPSVAVLGFENLSRQPTAEWLSTALTEMLSTELAAGGRLRTIPGERVSQVKLELTLPNAQTLAPTTLGKLRRSLGADFLILGSYLVTGEGKEQKVRLDLRLQDTSDGEVIAALTDTRSSSDLLELVTRAGGQLRQALRAGELASSEAASLRESMPDDPEAARFYAEGLDRLRALDTLAARDLLREAVREAPRHALSHSALAVAAGLLGYDSEARTEARLALELSNYLGREERLLIEARYHEIVRDWERAIDLYRTLHNYFPDNLEYGLRLAAVQSQAGHAHRALETLAAVRRLPPAAQDPRVDVAEAEAALAGSDLARARDAAARAASAGTAQELRLLAARAHLLESRVFMEMGDPPRSIEAARQSRALFEKAGHKQGIAWALNEAAGVLTQLGEVDAARANFEHALEICRSTGDQTCIGNDLDSLGVLRRRQGDLEGAVAMHEQALAVRREVGDRSGVAMALYNLGNVLDLLGDLPRARAAETEALDIRRTLGLRRTAALTMCRLANVRRKQGELVEAIKMEQEALAELRAIGDRGGAAMVLHNLGQALYDHGDLAASRKAHEEALAVRRQQADKNNTAQVLASLAAVSIAEDRLPEARKQLQESMALRESLGERIALAQTRLRMTELSLQEGQPEAGERLARDAAAEFRRAKTSGFQAEAYLLLARCRLAANAIRDARNHLNSARSLLRDSKDVRLLLAAEFVTAAIEEAQGRRAQAADVWERALADAGRMYLFGMELEARLALARLGRADLAQVASDARQRGWHLVARKAVPQSSNAAKTSTAIQSP
jgi:tetratricopeptide (TPR) repeat protein